MGGTDGLHLGESTIDQAPETCQPAVQRSSLPHALPGSLIRYAHRRRRSNSGRRVAAAAAPAALVSAAAMVILMLPARRLPGSGSRSARPPRCRLPSGALPAGASSSRCRCWRASARCCSWCGRCSCSAAGDDLYSAFSPSDPIDRMVLLDGQEMARFVSERLQEPIDSAFARATGACALFLVALLIGYRLGLGGRAAERLAGAARPGPGRSTSAPRSAPRS